MKSPKLKFTCCMF